MCSVTAFNWVLNTLLIIHLRNYLFIYLFIYSFIYLRILKTGTWRTATRVAVVTMNGAVGGGLSTILLNVLLSLKRKYLLNIPEFVGGVLGGLVAITAPANVIRPWEAVIIGMIGGLCTIGGK